MSDSAQITQLLNKYAAGDASPAELETLALLLERPDGEEMARAHLMNMLRQTEPLTAHSEERWQVIQEEIRRGVTAQANGTSQAEASPPSTAQGSAQAEFPANTPTGRLRPMNRPLIRWSTAAAAILILSLATWYRLGRHTTLQQPAIAKTNAPASDRLPGGNIAVLTLSDGSTIALDSAQNGTLAQQGNASIAKLANGQLAYNALHEKPGAVLYNTLTTPRGGQYKLILPDGTAVWLNAASSITYPTAFTEADREVHIAGEAYFEVRKDPARPFKVRFTFPHQHGAGSAAQNSSGNVSDTGTVEVLGTHFNINAYTDETAVKTTLLEGSVRVVGKKATVLKPGQQASSTADGATEVNPNANLDEVVAWKNGYFNFENADIRTVMRQLARWYDVDVVYEGKVPTEQFEGEIPRNSKLTEVFKILELSNVHFKVEDKKVTVMP